MSRDTIFALSSGSLPAGIAVVRVSGPAALSLLSDLAGNIPPPRQAVLRTLRDPGNGEAIDHALVLGFRGPASATGEDVAEFHLHGGVAVVSALLKVLERQPGCRMAEAGEFTRRAFDNRRLDLTQAEGLADLIAAQTDAQRRAALSHADGALRGAVERWRQALLELLASAEAYLDFAEEEADVAARLHPDQRAVIESMSLEIAGALADARRGQRLRDGLSVVVSGAPNVGKSSLVNALANSSVSIVSARPGTTRDIVEARLDLGGVAVTLVDTAGLRESDDEVEAEGIARARDRIATADLLLSVYCEGAAPKEGVAVRSKVDLLASGENITGLKVSVKHGEGVGELLDWLADWARTTVNPAKMALIAHRRQGQACERTLAELHRAQEEDDPVLRAESLRMALRHLGSITGIVSPEDILEVIFGKFCVGK